MINRAHNDMCTMNTKIMGPTIRNTLEMAKYQKVGHGEDSSKLSLVSREGNSDPGVTRSNLKFAIAGKFIYSENPSERVI